MHRRHVAGIVQCPDQRVDRVVVFPAQFVETLLDPGHEVGGEPFDTLLADRFAHKREGVDGQRIEACRKLRAAGVGEREHPGRSAPSWAPYTRCSREMR